MSKNKNKKKYCIPNKKVSLIILYFRWEIGKTIKAIFNLKKKILIS